MLRNLGLLLLTFSLALPGWAADRSGSISGYVRNSRGVPQMGAVVEILTSPSLVLKLFTDDRGYYTASGLRPGTYSVKVSAPLFLPTVRERVGLRAGAAALVNVTLNTLFEAVQSTPGRSPADQDDWEWVLRSVANRPILRVLPDGSAVMASNEGADHDIKGSLSFLAGSASGGFGSTSDMTTGFSVEKSLFSTGTVALQGNVGYNSGSPNAVLRASYDHKMANGSDPQVAITMRRLAAPDVNFHSGALEALSLSTSDNFALGNVLELKFGSELQTIQFMGRATAFRPYGTADIHLSPNTVLEYRYTTTEPDSRLEKGFDTAPADLSESGPHVSLAGYNATIERARHHEVSVSQRIGKTSLQVAAFSDYVSDPALTGVGELTGDSGEVLPDLYSGTFTYRGRNLGTQGARLVLQRKILSDLVATLDYSYGGVFDLEQDDAKLDRVRSALTVRDRHSLSGKLSGTAPRTKTRWTASYRWVNGRALTPVDWFNASAGQADPYLNLFIRQPIPGTGFLPCHMEAIIDVRNLLAEGYVPVLGQDGRTVYLVQTARTVRGGVTFTF